MFSYIKKSSSATKAVQRWLPSYTSSQCPNLFCFLISSSGSIFVQCYSSALPSVKFHPLHCTMFTMSQTIQAHGTQVYRKERLSHDPIFPLILPSQPFHDSF